MVGGEGGVSVGLVRVWRVLCVVGRKGRGSSMPVFSTVSRVEFPVFLTSETRVNVSLRGRDNTYVFLQKLSNK